MSSPEERLNVLVLGGSDWSREAFTEANVVARDLSKTTTGGDTRINASLVDVRSIFGAGANPDDEDTITNGMRNVVGDLNTDAVVLANRLYRSRGDWLIENYVSPLGRRILWACASPLNLPTFLSHQFPSGPEGTRDRIDRLGVVPIGGWPMVCDLKKGVRQHRAERQKLADWFIEA